MGQWGGLTSERGQGFGEKQYEAYREHDTPLACHSRLCLILFRDTDQDQTEHRFLYFMALGSFSTICVILEVISSFQVLISLHVMWE